MDTTKLSVIQNALPTLQSELRQAFEDLSELEGLEWNRLHSQVMDEPSGDMGEDWIRRRMVFRAERLSRLLSEVFESAGLLESRRSFQEDWDGISKNVGATEWLWEVDVLFSPALSLLQDTIDGLKAITGASLTAPEDDALQRVETILKSLPHLISNRGKDVKSEADIQVILDESMNLVFAGEYEPKPEIGGLIKGFHADGGVRTIGIAIELKFARSPDDVKRCIKELAADVAGYRGARDWKHFYAALVMEGPFITEAKFEAELRRMDAKNWKGFALHLGRTVSNS